MFLRKILNLFLVLFWTYGVSAQTPYDDPDHYVLDTKDNFQFFNYELWGSKLPNHKWGLEKYDSSMVSASQGILTLGCKKVGDSYISGGIETVNTRAFSYGYFEIESKLPESGTRGPWGGFWMHTGEGRGNEIDILEPNGCDCEKGNQFHSGVHATTNGIRYHTSDVFQTDSDLSLSYNKYSLIWTPEYVKVLMNGKFLYEIVDPLYVGNFPMYVFLTFQIDKWGCAPNKKSFPTIYWQFKNFKYYKLKTNCSVGIESDDFDFNNHDYFVQKYYLLENSIVPENSDIVLRVTDFVELKGGFSIPLGSSLTIISHRNTCPE